MGRAIVGLRLLNLGSKYKQGTQSTNQYFSLTQKRICSVQGSKMVIAL